MESFHNFVGMKKSLAYLPSEKQRDLRQLVEIIRSTISDCEMIILFGSYARDTYVDYDQRVEFGVQTYFMSDYDILILTERKISVNEHLLYGKIKKAYFQDKSMEFHTRPQFINDSIKDFNHQIEKGQYFYTDIKKQGIMLYDSGKYKLSRVHRLRYGEIEEIAKRYFEDKFGRADSFVRSARHDIDDQDCLMASFHLHQAAENYIRAVPMVYALYGYKEHDLAFLIDKARTHNTAICKAFPRDCQEEKRLFQLLQDAYVQARYNRDFIVTKEDVDALLAHVEHLRSIVEEICKEKLAEYGRLSKDEAAGKKKVG